MKREFLTGLIPNLSDDVLQKIIDENGKDINTTKAKYGDYDSLKQQLADANKTIDGFKSMDIDGIKKAADDWKQKAEQTSAEAEKQLKAVKLNYAIEAYLTGEKARNIKAVRAQLKEDALQLDGDRVLGLKEQVDNLKSNNETAFLFAPAAPVKTGMRQTGTGAESTNNNAEVNAAIRAAFGKD